MKNQTIAVLSIALLVAGVIGASGYGLYRLGLTHGTKMSNRPQPDAASPADARLNNQPLYWHDPMFPTQKFDKPGKSPFMDMQLVPVYGGQNGDDGIVSVSPRVEQNLGIRTAEVTKGSAAIGVTAVGNVAYNERDVELVEARANGYVEHLYVRAPFDPVHKGQPLAELYVPDWIAAQEEFLTVRHMQGDNVDVLVDAARQRMRLAGMNDEQIRKVENSGKVQARITLTAPRNGVVSDLPVREGMTVTTGTPLFRINGLGSVWINADIPEDLVSQIRPGNAVEARSASLPGVVLRGKVSALLPEVNPVTRTLKARIELANPAGSLVPGMFATLNFTTGPRKDVLLVPSEAVIKTGTRSVVMIAEGNGKFHPVDVDTGFESNGQTEIHNGLEAGQQVVVSGQFLIDSEASLKGTTTRMSTMPEAEKKSTQLMGDKP